jgi:hypothetical protein
MRTLESAEVCRTGQTVSPDVVATAEVLRSLYLPYECRHLVELLQLDAAAPARGADTRAAETTAARHPHPPASTQGEPAASLTNDELFLDLVETQLAGAATPMMQICRMRDLRDVLQVQVWFLDALEDRLRRAPGGGELTPRLPVREELTELLRRERVRYEPDREQRVSRAIQEQLRDG